MRRWGLRLLVVLLALLALAGAGAWWLLKTSPGARLTLERVARMAGPGLAVEGVEGELLGGLRIARLVYEKPGLRAELRDVRLDATPRLSGAIDIHHLSAASVEVRTAPGGGPARIPSSFGIPYAVRVEDARVGELRLGELAATPPVDASRERDVVLRDVRLRGEADGSRIRVDELAAGTPYGAAKVAGTLGTAQPFSLEARAELAGERDLGRYRVAVTASGSLKALEAKLEGALGDARATGRAVLEPFAPVPVRSLTAQVRDLDVAALSPGAPHTRLAVDAELAAESRAYAGPVRITNADPGPIDAQRLPFTAAQGRIVVSTERLDVSDAHVALAGGGTADGRATVEKGRVQADLRVSEANLAAIHGALQATKLTGTASVESTGEGQRFQVDLRDPRFAVDGRGAFAAGRLEVENARVRHAGGSLAGSGALSTTGAREFRFAGRAEHFDPSAFARVPKGDLNFTFSTTGTLGKGPAGEATVEFAPSRYAGLAAGGRVAVSGDRARIAKADVDVSLGEARLQARGSFGRAGDAMDVALRAPNLSVLAQPFGVAVAGRLEGTARLTGTFAAPAGRVDLAASNLALPGHVYFRDLSLKGEAGADPASRIEARLQATGLSVGEEKPPQLLAQALTATLDGTRAAHKLTLDAQLTRDQRLTGALEGGLDARSATPAWSGRVQSLALTGPSAFTLQAPATLQASARRVELGEARLKGAWGDARLETTRWTPDSLDLKGSSPGLAITSTARALRLPEVRRSTLVMAADWDLHAGETLDGRVAIRRVSGDLRVGDPVMALGLQEATAAIDVVRGRMNAVVDVRADRVGRLQGRAGGHLVRGASGWEFSPSAPLDGRIEADVPNLEPLAPWLGADARLAGRLRANVVVAGSGRSPAFTGEVVASGLALREPQTGFEIDQGEVVLRLRDRAIAIERFEATAPWRPSKGALAKIGSAPWPQKGRVTAQGSIDLASRTGTVTVRAEALPLTQLDKRFVAISGEAKLEARGEQVAVTGTLRADAAWIGALATALPSVSDDVVVVRASQPAAAAPKAGPRIALDVRIDLGEHTYFQGRGLDTRLAGSLRVQGEPPALRATGAIRTVEGTYDGYGQKLAIERGTIAFSGSLENPSLDVLALRKGLPVEAGAEVYGTASHVKVRLVSRPDVPEPEKLSWLVLGRPPAETSQADASTLMAAARALLGGNAPGSDLVKRFGIDEVRVGRPDAASALGALPQSTVAGKTGTATAGDVVTVGKRITKDVHLIYEQGLADAEGALRLSWQLTEKFQLLLRAGYLPGVDAVWRWSFQ